MLLYMFDCESREAAVSGGPKEIGMMVYMRESGISASRSDLAMCVLSQ